MKIMFILLSIVISAFSFGQGKLKSNKPIYLLDSKVIDIEYFLFDANKIEKIDIVKNVSLERTDTIRTIYITSKQPKNFNFLSYEQIKSKYFADKSKPILLLLNGAFIKSPTKLNIDSSYIFKVEIESGADFEELKNIYPLLAIVNIKTKNVASLNDERQINLEGPERQIFLNGLPNKSFPE